MPLVSIVIPVYNGTNYLREALDSALAQTYSNYEIVVIDDGSKDGTWDLIQTYGPRIRGIRKENGGTSSALNLGIQESRGKYISWLSHDDKYLPAKVETQVAYLQSHPEYQLCCCDYHVIDENGASVETIQSPWYPRSQIIPKLLAGNFINGLAILIEKRCFETAGLFDGRWRFTHDYDVWLRVLRLFDMGKVEEPLVVSRVHQKQVTLKNYSLLIEETRELVKHVLDHWTLQDIFRELPSNPTPEEISAAYVMLADTILASQDWFMFAKSIYDRAIRAYPSWKNSARRKAFACILREGRRRAKNVARSAYHKIRGNSPN